MKCPACGQPLVVVEREDIEVDWCPACEGIWFDTDELDILAARAGKTLAPESIGEKVAQHKEKRRRCPRCHHKMEKVTPFEEADFFLDRCPEHGLWCDAGELGALLHALPARHENTATVVEFLNETFSSNQETSQ